MYTNVNELLRAMRRSLAAHPAERDTLKAIATIARRDGLEAGIAAYEDWKQSRLAGAPDDAAKPALPAASSPAPAHVSQPDGPTCTAITQDAPCGITGQSTQPGKADARQSGALEPTPKGNDAPDDATRTGGITKQSTLPSEADAGALPAGESSPAAKSRFEPFEPDVEGSIANLVRQASGKASGRASGTSPSTPAHARQTDTQPSGASRQAQTHAEPAVDTSPSDAPQNAPEGTTRQSTQPGEAASQPDDALVRLRAQIDGCLAMETNPALRLFLEQLRRDIHKYPAEFVHQELEAYLQPGTPGDFLDRLAALHMSWALDDVAVDPDGKRLVRGTPGRKAILECIEAAFRAETEPVARCYLAKLARKAVSNPPGAGEGLEGYIDARTSPTWLWLAAVFVTGSPEAAFQWRLQEARRKTADARLSGYLDKLEQEARESLPMAVSKLEAFIEILALTDGATHTIPAQNAPETITDGAQPCAVA